MLYKLGIKKEGANYSFLYYCMYILCPSTRKHRKSPAGVYDPGGCCCAVNSPVGDLCPLDDDVLFGTV